MDSPGYLQVALHRIAEDNIAIIRGGTENDADAVRKWLTDAKRDPGIPAVLLVHPDHSVEKIGQRTRDPRDFEPAPMEPADAAL